MGLTILLQGQDITDFVDESTISINSVLGQGQGVGGQGTGSATTANFLTDLGPIKTARGAGESVPPATRNLFSANQSSTEDDVNMTEWGGIAYTTYLGTGNIARDLTKSWTGLGSLKVTMQGASTFESVCINIPSSEIIPGETYTASAYLMASAGQTPNLRFFIEGNDQIAGNHALSATSLHATPVDGMWTRYEISVTMPAVITDSYIGLRLDAGGVAQAVTFWIDGLQFEQFPSATAWHLGRTTPTPLLVRGGEITITDATGTVVFGGWVNELEDATDALTVHTILDCVDYLEGLDRIEVNEVFTGSDDIAIIRFIMTNYAPDVDLSDIPATGTYPFQKRYIRAKSVKEALIGIATITGYAVWVTPDKKLEYKPPTEVSTAPFTLSDDPDFSASFGYDIINHTLDDSATINRVTFYGGQQESDDFDQDLSVQANGVNRVLLSAYYPHDASDGAIHVIQNSIEQAVGSPFDAGSSGKLKRDGGTSDVLVNRDAKTLTFNNAPLKTDTLIFRYRYTTPLRIEVADRASFAFFGKWYDGKLDDSTVLDAVTAVQRARVLLSEQSYGLESLKIETHTGGLQAGQLLHITNELRGIDQTYLIQSVTVDPEGAGFFKYTVSLGAWNWNLIDLLYSITKRAGVQDDSTEEDTSVVQAEEVAESVVVTDSVTLTTTATGAYYCGHCYCGFATVTF